VITLARTASDPVEEKALPREMLYLADELFFTGTAAEITPIRSVDRHAVGAGKRGPVTATLQKAFFDVIECRAKDEHGWLTFVPARRGGGGRGKLALGAGERCTSTIS
jgi:branched-chain amino acid aminotransferase